MQCTFFRNISRALPAVVAALLLPAAAYAQTAAPKCSFEVKESLAVKIGEANKLPDAGQADALAGLYKEFSYCAEEAAPAAAFLSAARQCGAAVGYSGSLFFEEMSCCGYDPQRRTFACPVKIKQKVGFGGSPLPGSREYVLNCVADASGVLQPVGDDSVHLSNSQGSPTWQFAVVANAVNNIDLVQPMNGTTRRARSILSWGFRPTACDFRPIWGNWLDYRIRLDQ